MLTLTVLKGLPASGKSTWAKEQAENNFNTIIVSRDNIREMLKGKYTSFPHGTAMEDLVTHIESFCIQMALMHGYNVIIDSTGFRWTQDKLQKYTITQPVDIQIKDFTNVPLEECIVRDSQRECPVGEEVIRRMHNKYLKKFKIDAHR